MVWVAETGATEMHMKPNASGESIAGCFILFEPGQVKDGAGMLEDGFSMRFTPQNWALFVNAVATGQFLHLQGSDDGMDFILNWGDQPLISGERTESDSESTLGNIFKKLLGKFKK